MLRTLPVKECEGEFKPRTPPVEEDNVEEYNVDATCKEQGEDFKYEKQTIEALTKFLNTEPISTYKDLMRLFGGTTVLSDALKRASSTSLKRVVEGVIELNDARSRVYIFDPDKEEIERKLDRWEQDLVNAARLDDSPSIVGYTYKNPLLNIISMHLMGDSGSACDAAAAP